MKDMILFEQRTMQQLFEKNQIILQLMEENEELKSRLAKLDTLNGSEGNDDK